MTHQFIINTESVNSYGYRILTAGIDYTQYMKNPIVLFMHDRHDDDNRGSEVIGTTKSLTVENNQLIAEIEFDEVDEFAKKIAGKVERNVLRMASMFAEKTETSTQPEDVLPGQLYETVKTCKLIEVSIVDIGGNDDALKLSKSKNQSQLKLLNKPEIKKNMDFKTIALALGKDANIDEAATLAAVNELKLAKETATNEGAEWKAKFIALQKSEAEGIVEQAVKLGLVNEALKDAQVSDLLSDFDAKKVVLSKLITEKTAEVAKAGKQSKAATAVQLAAGITTATEEEKDCFDFLQKNNSIELKRIQTEEPLKYAQLAKAYVGGKRFTAAK
jgi:hypothetical protein